MSFLVDTHAHIYLDEFRDDRAEMMLRAHEKGIGRIYMPNVDHTSIDGMLELEAQYPERCFAMMGLHPCYIKADFQKELYLVEEWLAKRKFAAVGEIGTDLYWDKSLFDYQKEAFIIQVNWAKKYHLPIVIHCRESIDQTIDLVQQMQDGSLSGIFHCFSGTVEQALQITKLGFYLGIGGVATFKNGGLDKVLPDIELKHLVLETDSPYLAPVPHRGKRNEPSYIPLVAKKVAEFKDISIDEVQRATTENALKLFKSNDGY